MKAREPEAPREKRIANDWRIQVVPRQAAMVRRDELLVEGQKRAPAAQQWIKGCGQLRRAVSLPECCLNL